MERKAKKKLRLLVLVIVIIIAAGFGVREASKFMNPIKYVSEVTSEPERYLNKPVQVTGFIVAGSLKEVDTNLHEFKLTDGDSALTVSYSGVLPSNMQDKAGVTAIGTLVSADKLVANKLLVKCPSKYEQEYSEVAEK